MMRRIFMGLGFLFLVASAVNFFYYWDPSRIFFMGLKSKNSFAFEPLGAEFLTYDPHGEITIKTLNEVTERRSALTEVLLGSNARLLPSKQEVVMREGSLVRPVVPCDDNARFHGFIDCHVETYMGWDSLLEIRDLHFDLEHNYSARPLHFVPTASNGKAVLFHMGYADVLHSQYVHIKRLLEQGYHVLGFSFATYGDNAKDLPGIWRDTINGTWTLSERPLSIVFVPVIGGLEYLAKDHDIDQFAMMGISAGGWVSAVSAALDPRIEKSYPIAGVLPIALRQGDKERAAPQFYAPMLEIAGYLDMFVMASAEPNRSQTQIFNRYDRCCFNNVRGKLYEEAVAGVPGDWNGGAFSVAMDETHARHKISSWTMDKILQDLEDWP